MYDPVSDTPAQARTSALSEEVGMARYLLSDKTGTLTQNIMEFVGCSVRGVIYGEPTAATTTTASAMQGATSSTSTSFPKNSPHSRHMKSFSDERMFRDVKQKESQAVDDFMLVMSVCHRVIPVHKDTRTSIQDVGAEAFHSQVFSLLCFYIFYFREAKAVYVFVVTASVHFLFYFFFNYFCLLFVHNHLTLFPP